MANILDLTALTMMTEDDVNQLTYIPVGDNAHQQLSLGYQMTLKMFLKWYDRLLVERGVDFIPDDYWAQVDPDQFRAFIGKHKTGQLPTKTTALPSSQVSTKAVNPVADFKKGIK